MAVDEGLDPDQVDLDPLVYGHVVEGKKDAAVDARLEQGSALQREVAGRPAFERIPLFAKLDLRQEAKPTGVDPEHRNVGTGRLLGRPQQGAVTPDADDQAGAVELALQRARALLRGGAIGPDTKAARLELPSSLHHRGTADVDARMADDAHRVSHVASNAEGTRDCPSRPGWARGSRRQPRTRSPQQIDGAR